MFDLFKWQPWFARSGMLILRYSLVLIFLGFGVLKFTHAEAEAIAPLTQHSLLMFWIAPAFGVDGASAVIGVAEILIALSIALRRPFPLLSAFGSLGAAFALLNTVSFLFTTPGLDPTSTDAGFLIKDVTLLGAALFIAADALAAFAARRDRRLDA